MLRTGFIKSHQLFQTLLVMGGGGGGHTNSVLHFVKLCVLINFSLQYNVLCLSFVVVCTPCIAYMQLLKGFSLMKEAVMCNKKLRLKVHSRSTDHQSLLKHRNLDFALSRTLNLIFRRVG